MGDERTTLLDEEIVTTGGLDPQATAADDDGTDSDDADGGDADSDTDDDADGSDDS